MLKEEPIGLGTSSIRGKNVLTLVKGAAELMEAKAGDEIGFFYSEEIPDYILIAKVETQRVRVPLKKPIARKGP